MRGFLKGQGTRSLDCVYGADILPAQYLDAPSTPHDHRIVLDVGGLMYSYLRPRTSVELGSSPVEIRWKYYPELGTYAAQARFERNFVTAVDALLRCQEV
jgi:hypothetical protein